MRPLADFVSETSSTVGDGLVIDLDGPEMAHRSFVAAGFDGKRRSYVIKDGEEEEVGIGTVTAGSPDTLSRDEIIYSTNSGNRIVLTGAARVYQSVSAHFFGNTVPEEDVATTDATPTTLASFDLEDDSRYLIEVVVNARRTDSFGGASFVRRCAAYREAAGAATIVGTVDTDFTRPLGTAYAADLVASGNAIEVVVTGDGTDALTWTMATTKFLKVS